MFSRFKVNDAISFVGKSFSLTKSFKNDLLNSQDPILISIVGSARSGKSTYANMLLNPIIPTKANSKDIGFFKVDAGNIPVTKQIQYTKLKLSTLIKKHDISINIQPNNDHDIYIYFGLRRN